MKRTETDLRDFLREREEELCLELVERLPEGCPLHMCAPVRVVFSKSGRIIVRGDSSPVGVVGGDVVKKWVALPVERALSVIRRLRKKGVKVIVACRPHGRHIEELARVARREGIEVVRTRLSFSDFVRIYTEKMLDAQAKTLSVHGVLLDIFGVGVLITGPSGIGKSEVALELITRGARLVSDDVIEVVKRDEESLYGMSPPLTRYHMEIRGLGIINIRDLFGVAAVRQRKKIELVIEMVPWEMYHGDEVTTTEEFYELLGVKVPLLKIPVAPGRSMATLVEIAARNYLLKRTGVYSGEDFERRLEERMEKSANPSRGED